MMMSSWNTNGGVEGKGTKFATTTSTDPDEEEKNQPQRRVGAGLRRNSCVGHHSLQSTLIVQSTISVTHQRRPDLLRRGMGRRRRGEEEEGEDAGEEDGYMDPAFGSLSGRLWTDVEAVLRLLPTKPIVLH